MTYRFCHRCQADLPSHDEGTLFYCSNCGAAQLLLSEDLQSQVELQMTAAADGIDLSALATDPGTLVWPGAMRYAALAGAIVAGLMVLSILIPPVFLMTVFWMVISPVVVIGLFQTRFPLTAITTSFGARLGLITGLSVATGLSIVCTIMLLLGRFRLHTMGEFDKQWALAAEQLQARMAGQSGGDVAAVVQMFSLPEFRAGAVLVGIACVITVLLMVTTAGGAFAGFARRRPRV